MTTRDHKHQNRPPGPAASVLATGQQPSRIQRRGRYVPESMRHPGKMLPSIAATVIGAYSRPGDWVLDPMCGIGTTLVEAAHLGRHSYGIEYERRWAVLAAANLRHAVRQGAQGSGQAVQGDARHTSRLVPQELHGRIGLVVTSPPYGSATHGHVRSTRDSGQAGVAKWNAAYSDDRENLAHLRLEDLLGGFGQILTGCAQVMRPGGIVAVTVRPFRVHGELVDLPGHVAAVGEQAGLVLVDRLVALLCGLRDGRLVNRASFFQMVEARRARERGLPVCAVAHEDLLIFQTPQTAACSGKPRGSARAGRSRGIQEIEQVRPGRRCGERADAGPGIGRRSCAGAGQRIGLDERSRGERACPGPAPAEPGHGCGGTAPGCDGCGAQRPTVGGCAGGAVPNRRTDAHDPPPPPQPRARHDGRPGDGPGTRRGRGGGR